MSTRNIRCEWFGHANESTGPDRTTDFPSERFVCTRCGHTHSVNEWATPEPAPKIRKALLIVIALGLLGYLPTVFQDAQTYRSIVGKKGVCCGFVPESVIARPVTYALVDAWSEPVWRRNEVGTERWLVSEGEVDGELKFWRILERQQITNQQEGQDQ
ncbi:hypothetical protein [Stutzerimonas stutzeri]|uniref:Uncharacterized protein n=1 Tax=Stutzerimonas stutzeri TaxID=316 RepID=A0AA40V6Q0_STUST|nr:hypothetical protein [Stutzerimonas stutzeri]MBA1305948.1 hypothetical protein [Stutzerimonas stutzeri]